MQTNDPIKILYRSCLSARTFGAANLASADGGVDAAHRRRHWPRPDNGHAPMLWSLDGSGSYVICVVTLVLFEKKLRAAAQLR